ncbi:hypothetical protein KPH14_005653 [Odynerus spinipes]|uniref:Uncharacterized protein n=1 Tax=Odynerus spinipes TaxID=1348599 RepID=A0AAD9VJR9_9HYME|nr:hypothetical protein KPH14_005653 [Odynerus spinipes]
MARNIFFALLLATAIFAYVQAAPTSEELPQRGDIPIEELYPELRKEHSEEELPQRGDIPIEELYPELFPELHKGHSEVETEAELAKFKDDLKEAWRKVKTVVKEKYEEVVNDSRIRETIKDSADKLVEKTKEAIEKVLDSARQKIDKITQKKPEPEVAGIKDKAQEAWNDFKKLVEEKYHKIIENPKVQEIMQEAEKAVQKAKDTVNNILSKVREEIEKIRQ